MVATAIQSSLNKERMANSEAEELLQQMKHLLAENKSLAQRLEDYRIVIDKKNREIETLNTMLDEANALRSSVDFELNTLKILQKNMAALDDIANGYIDNLDPKPSTTEEQFDRLKQAYSFLQARLPALQMQLQELNNKNLLLQQEESRTAELESLLSNALEELEEWKALAKLKQDKSGNDTTTEL